MHLKVSVVEVVHEVPAEGEELVTFDDNGVEEDEAEEDLLVALRPLVARELRVVHTREHALHVRLEALCGPVVWWCGPVVWWCGPVMWGCGPVVWWCGPVMWWCGGLAQ